MRAHRCSSPRSTRRAISAHVLEAASALAGRRVDLGDLAPVVDAGLASVDESGIRFRHPLIRSAIYQHASLADRQASHTALAAAYEDDPDRSVWHRAAALVAPDDSVVDELEEAAARARRRGAPSAAAVALRRAAQLTNHTPRRATLLIGAAELEHEIGHHDIALRTVQEARWLDLDHPTRLRVAFLLETLESRWSGSEKVSAFVDLAEELGDAGEADQALRALATVAMRCWWGNPEQTTRERVVAVAERLATPEREPLGLAVLALADPINRGRLVLERLARPEAVELDDPLAMYMLGTAATSVWAHNLGLPFLAAAVDGFRAQGRLGLLAQALVSSAWAAVHVADARVATPAAAEGARLADETGQPRWAAAALLAQATMVAERGDPEAAEELTARAERVLLPMGANPMLSLVQFARGRAAIAQARHTDAYEHLSRIYDPADVAFHPFVGGWAAGDFIDAAARGGGELAVARDVLGHHERIDGADRGASPAHPDAVRAPASRLRRRGRDVVSGRAGRPRARELALLSRDGCSSPTAPGSAGSGAWPSHAFRSAWQPRPSTRSASWGCPSVRGKSCAPPARRAVPVCPKPGTSCHRRSCRSRRWPPRADQPRDRSEAVSLASHDRLAPLPHLSQARHHVSRTARRVTREAVHATVVCPTSTVI